MDTVTLLKRERDKLFDTLSQNSVKLPLITSNCPGCHETANDMSYYTQTESDCNCDRPEIPQQNEIPQEVIDFQIDGVDFQDEDEEVVENVQQTTNVPLFL